mmetsp:Transcript_30082/g.69393  ORF Transcript_30082/g.69393 Transcript_30082/m.69393 type:complete len:206 (-) Transcript_30082:179-796(-)
MGAFWRLVIPSPRMQGSLEPIPPGKEAIRHCLALLVSARPCRVALPLSWVDASAAPDTQGFSRTVPVAGCPRPCRVPAKGEVRDERENPHVFVLSNICFLFLFISRNITPAGIGLRFGSLGSVWSCCGYLAFPTKFTSPNSASCQEPLESTCHSPQPPRAAFWNECSSRVWLRDIAQGARLRWQNSNHVELPCEVGDFHFVSRSS